MRNEKAKEGDIIKIVRLDDQYDHTYPGRIGEVKFVDSMGQLHGTWGGLAVVPEVDEYEIIKKS